MRDNSKFRKGLEKLKIELTEDQFTQFEDYFDLLIKWNNVMNLTAITEYSEVVTKHFLDSLSIVQLTNVSCETFGEQLACNERRILMDSDVKKNSESVEYIKRIGQESEIKTLEISEQMKLKQTSCEDRNRNVDKERVLEFNGKSLLDLGTGAGFPGIPLKIAFPELNIVLVDSLNKRINFLNEVIGHLSLKKIHAVHGRAEELGRKDEFREKYDYCVSRAVARLVSLSEYCIPFVKKGGYFISYKSGKSEEELAEAEYAIGQLGAKCEGQFFFQLPESDMERSLILIRKCRETPNKYPRAGGKPTSKPLVRVRN